MIVLNREKAGPCGKLLKFSFVCLLSRVVETDLGLQVNKSLKMATQIDSDKESK